jgi:hypothetical protein
VGGCQGVEGYCYGAVVGVSLVNCGLGEEDYTGPVACEVVFEVGYCFRYVTDPVSFGGGVEQPPDCCVGIRGPWADQKDPVIGEVEWEDKVMLG